MVFKLKFISLIIISLFLINCNNKEDGRKVIYEDLKDSGASTEKPAPQSQSIAAITFEESEFDFGTLQEGMVANHTFKFKNTGNVPLIVTDAKPSCGCTTPSFTKEPVMPGKEGSIEVSYDSKGKSGVISKTVTVIANTEPSATVLTIKAMVKEKASGSPIKKQ